MTHHQLDRAHLDHTLTTATKTRPRLQPCDVTAEWLTSQAYAYHRHCHLPVAARHRC